MNETTDMIYGKLLESAHMSGYSTDRACDDLEYLLEDDRWKSVGSGFDDINEFVKSLNSGAFKVPTDKRKKLAKKLEELEATQRATAHALGVSQKTIGRDLNPESSDSKEKVKPRPDNDLKSTPESYDSKTNEGLFSSDTNEWCTPNIIVERVVKALGSIDCDPCADPQKAIPARKHFVESDDGLSKSWKGTIYMNPPYGSELHQWVNKLTSEYNDGGVTSAIALVPSRTDTKWFRGLRDYPRCFIWGRLRFNDSNPAPFPSMAVYFGKALKRFARAFKDIGDIYVYESDS
tara:strand:+ start:1141 stop:2013 length:873 start_codon:yes stop_codon:yes gene_type:complete